jgi:multiple sugar transport system ATP-binding protein
MTPGHPSKRRPLERRRDARAVTHDQIEAMTLASRIAVMDRGQIQQLAAPEIIYNQPANLFVARFLGTPPMNTLSARLCDGEVPAAVIGAGRPDEVRLPLRLPEQARSYIDKEVIIGIRPEYICEEGRGFATRISAPVELTEPTGAETIVLIRLAGERARARVAPQVKLAVGAPAAFSVDTAHLCLFDPRTEQLIPGVP